MAGPDLSDPQQFQAACRIAEPQLRAYVKRVREYSEYVDDILQSTWLIALEHAHQYTGRGSVTGWMFRICQSVARSTTIQDKRLPPSPLTDEIAIGDEYSESGEYRLVELEDARLALLESLTSRRREIVEAHFVNGRTDVEIAEALGCRPTTVRTTIHHIRAWCRARDPAETILK